MTIRGRGFASLDELVAVQNRLAEQYSWSAPHAKQHLDEYISQFGSNPEWLFVAEEAGTVQGALLASDRGKDGSLLISSFGVFPEYQRTGVGTALLAEAERRARQRGSAAARQRGKVRLLVGAADGTEPFYLKCGFTPRLYSISRSLAKRAPPRCSPCSQSVWQRTTSCGQTRVSNSARRSSTYPG